MEDSIILLVCLGLDLLISINLEKILVAIIEEICNAYRKTTAVFEVSRTPP